MPQKHDKTTADSQQSASNQDQAGSPDSSKQVKVVEATSNGQESQTSGSQDKNLADKATEKLSVNMGYCILYAASLAFGCF